MIKLLKYELKQTWRMAVTLLAGVLLGCVGLICNPFGTSTIMFFLQNTFFTIVVIGSCHILFIYCMGSFNQEFMKPQGYLTMTLPIKARDLIGAKFIAQLMWNMISISILLINAPFIIKRYSANNIGIGVLGAIKTRYILFGGLSSYALIVFIIYFSIVILSTQPRTSHNNFIKIILAMILVHIINISSNLVSLLLMGFSFIIHSEFTIDGMEMKGFLRYIQNNVKGFNLVNIIINLIFTITLYFITKKIIESKVQL